MNALEDRMKQYEKYSDIRLLPKLPVLCRIDGKCFHAVTRNLQRPYDQNFILLMESVMAKLAQQTVATCAYHQSDEITLAWTGAVYCEGRVAKLTSILASMATYYFNNFAPGLCPPITNNPPPLFDCRVWVVPSLDEAANVFVWREQDCTRNSIQMAGQHYFSHNEMMNKSNDQVQEMLFSRASINWNDYPDYFKRGTYCIRSKVKRLLTEAEVAALPSKHQARQDPFIERHIYDTKSLEFPLASIANKVGTLFFGEEPVKKENVDTNNE